MSKPTRVEPGQIYQMYREDGGDVYVIIEPQHSQFDGWIIFNITRSRFEWDMASQFKTQYRRLA